MLNKVRIYTDGSAYKGKGGWGVYLVNGKDEEFYKGRTPENTTISRMEMSAMLKALELALRFKFVDIYSDSQMVVNSINKGWLFRWERDGLELRKNNDIWKDIIIAFRKLKKNRVNFTIHHINGHGLDNSDPHVFGNNVADILANYKN